MRVLVVGGSGYVASQVLPLVAREHTLRVFDLRPPLDSSWEYHAGNINDAAALLQAAADQDALLYMAMGDKNYGTMPGVISNLDVNIKGVYLALYAAHQAGIQHAVYTSGMSVYAGPLLERYFADEELTPDATEIYGFSKRLGEEACRNATREWGMSVNVLRLCFPIPEAEWLAATRAGTPTIATTSDDVARAILAALAYKAGFQPFMISGDYNQKVMNMAKAKRLLGWEPLARPAS